MLKFGTHGIDLADATKYLLEKMQVKVLLEYDSI